MTKINRLHIFALGAHGSGISGGDRIFIELARRWSEKFPIDIYLWKQGLQMCKSQNLSGKHLTFKQTKISEWSENIFLINYLLRIFEGVRLGLTLNFENKPTTFVYNASEFWMDSFPCAILKIRFPKIKWIATWYQTAPNPLRGFKESGVRDESYKLSALLYWLAQLPIKPLITKFADKVIVNNDDEKKRFPEHTKNGDTIVMIGAVPLESINEWVRKTPNVKNEYDAVFQGRFHPQKGVLELIDIWKLVVKNKPDANLAMIGDGPLMYDVRSRIKDVGLEKNIKLFGYVFDGDQKYKIFSSSRVVVHPAFYDSGGMASAEAMAFGLPCVGFDLKAYESYYPKGMVKVPIGNKEEFAEKVIMLLNDKKYYDKISKDAIGMILKNWSWETRANEILNQITI